MLINDLTIKKAIKAAFQSGDPLSRIVIRQKLALKEKDWHAALRSISVDGVINGWLITRSATRSRKLGTGHFSYEWDYSLTHFRSMRDDGEGDNSENDVNAALDAIADILESSGNLGFYSDYDMPNGKRITFDNHGELQIQAEDTINNEVHFVQALLTCYLTKQG